MNLPQIHARHLRERATRAACLAACLLPVSQVAWADVAPPQSAAAGAAAKPNSDASSSFDLNEIRVDGDTVLPQEQVEEVVYPFLGPGRTAKDVEAARVALQDAYKAAGFVTVSVQPGRWVDRQGGVVLLTVIERRVGRLRVKGAKYFVPDAVREGAPSVAPGSVPNVKAIAADLAGLNMLPDRTVEPSLRPGRLRDTVDVDLDVTDKLPLHGTLELNNRNNADTTPLRLNASLTYDNLFQRGDSASFSYSVAPENVRDAEIESASYLFHIPDSKLSLLLTYLHSNSNIIALGTTDVAGRGSTAGFRLLVPLGTTTDGAGGSFTHSFSVGWDYKRFYELDQFGNEHNGQFLEGATAPNHAPITYYPLAASYAANWSGPKSTTDVNLGLTLGLDQAGSDAAQFDNKRLGANPNFAVLHATVTREQDLPHDVQLWGSVQAQETNEPLVQSEQFGLGGADSVRGYLEAEALGDWGVSAQTELRSPDIKKYVKGPLRSWRFHLFADGGIIGNRQPIPSVGTRTSQGLSSAGVGTRVNLWGYLNGAVQDAQVFNSGPNTRAGTNRVLFRVYGEF